MEKSKKNKLLHKEVIDKIGSFYFYDNYMISEISEGVIVDYNLVSKITNQLTKKFYGTDVPFVFISNRVNSYSVDPTIHLKTKSLLPNTKGYAVVSYSYVNNEIGELERIFLDIPTVIVKTLQEAIAWANKMQKKD